MDTPRERNLSLWTYHLRTVAALEPPDRPEDRITDLPSLHHWQQEFRDRLRTRLGTRRDTVALDLTSEARPSPTDRGFARHRMLFASERHLDVSAWLLVPDDRSTPGPAVLAIHGHGPDSWPYDLGRDAVAGPPPADVDKATAYLAQCATFGEDLARAGFVVLAPDLRGFGERWDGWRDGHRLCDLELAQSLARGDLPIAGNLRDLSRCLDVLAGHALVDEQRIGVAGFSYGGTVALFLAALDDRVRAAVVSSAFSDPRVAAEVPFNLCGAQVLPGLLPEFDHVQLAAAIAPRALLVENGDEDFLWPADAAQVAAQRVAQVYESVGASDGFAAQVFSGGHRWNGDQVERFFTNHLTEAPG